MGLKDAWKAQDDRYKRIKADANKRKIEIKDHKRKMSTDENYKQSHQLDKLGLDIDSYSDSEIKQKNIKNIGNVSSQLTGNELMKAGMGMSASSPKELMKITYLSSLVEQNWILIRQNEQILRELKRQRKHLEGR